MKTVSAPRILVFVFLMICALPLHAVSLHLKKPIDEKVQGYLKEILNAAGLKSATVTRGSTTPKDQARVMYDYYLKSGANNCKQSTFELRKACALKSYGSIGDAAINAISDWENRENSIKEMTKTIVTKIEEAGDTRNQMAHVPISGRYAIDVAPSSISDDKAFKQAVENHSAVIKTRFFWPGKSGGPAESAYHIEFRLN